MVKKIILIIIIGLSICFLTCCNGKEKNQYTNNNENNIIGNSDFEIWSAPSTEKILATVDMSQYSSVREDKIILNSAKNEFESGQIVVSAKDDLSFTVSITDLVHMNSGYKIDKSNFELYILKYTRVSRNYYGNGAPTGMYPDAIIPLENAYLYNLNVIKKGENGGVWINFFIPENAEVGNYQGSATIKVGNKEQSITIELKVFDVTVPSENTSKSLFGGNGYIYSMELDISTEMQDKYIQYAIDHRVSPTHVMTSDNYADDWYKWYQKGITTLGMIDGNSEQLKNQIISCAKKSLEVNKNMVSKLALFPSSIDEPFLWQSTDGIVSGYVEGFKSTLNEIASELNELEEFKTSLGQEIIESVSHISLVVTDYASDEYGNAHRYYTILKDANGNPWYYPNYVSICGKPDGYDSETERAGYYNGAEQWWYTCNDPKYPYPTYHTDDSLVSANAIGWMMAEYDIVGNLLWNYTFHVTGLGSEATYMEDPYSEASRGQGANGDGYLVYPGKMYEVDGPIGTIRFDAIRDSLEDYELIKILKAKYASKGIDAKNIIRTITSSIYNGTKMTGGSKEFEDARIVLLSILEMALNKTEFYITDISKNTVSDILEYVLTATSISSTAVYSDGLKVEEIDGVYTIRKTLNDDKNYFNIRAVNDDKTIEFSMYIGGKQKAFDLPDDVSLLKLSGDIESTSRDNDFYKIILSGSKEFKSVNIEHESIKEINANTAKYVINVKNYGETSQYRIYITYSKYGKVQALTGSINPGNNQISIDIFSTANWERNGEVTSITIAVSGTNEIGIGKIIIFGA